MGLVTDLGRAYMPGWASPAIKAMWADEVTLVSAIVTPFPDVNACASYAPRRRTGWPFGCGMTCFVFGMFLSVVGGSPPHRGPVQGSRPHPVECTSSEMERSEFLRPEYPALVRHRTIVPPNALHEQLSWSEFRSGLFHMNETGVGRLG